MASSDTQILGTGSKPAPLDYRLPLNSELILKAVRADFDGSAASVSYLPALEIISDAGHLVATCPVSSPVAAGASAEVSWFPGALTSTQGTVFDQAGLWLLTTDTPYTIGAGVTDTILFASANFLVGGFLDVPAGLGRFDIEELNAIYFFSLSVRWEPGNFPRTTRILVPPGTGGVFLPQYTDRHDLQPAGAFTADNPTGLGQLWQRDTALVHPSSNGSPGIRIEAEVHNGDGAPRDVVEAYFAAYAVGLGSGPPV